MRVTSNKPEMNTETQKFALATLRSCLKKFWNFWMYDPMDSMSTQRSVPEGTLKLSSGNYSGAGEGSWGSTVIPQPWPYRVTVYDLSERG